MAIELYGTESSDIGLTGYCSVEGQMVQITMKTELVKEKQGWSWMEIPEHEAKSMAYAILAHYKLYK
jgi:hypothetical protein